MKVIGFDYPCMDMNVLCHHIPAKDEIVELQDISLMGGGKVANAIAAAARLGAATAFIGAVGEDRYGKMCLEDLKAHGTDVSYLKVHEGRTSLCISIVDSARQEKHYIESVSTVAPFRPEEIPMSIFDRGDYLMLYQIDETARYLMEKVHEAGGKTVVDGDEYDRRTQESMKDTDVFIMSEYYYNRLFAGGDIKDNLRKIAVLGPEIVVATMGSAGCVGVENGRFFKTGAYRVEVHDTTGAGDVFHGAFVCGLTEGMSAEEASDFASAVSAIKCTVLGGRSGIPTRKCVEHFRNTGEIIPEDFAQREKKYRDCVWK